MARVATGLEVLAIEGATELRGRRVGLLCHAASVTSDLRHAADILAARGDLELVALLAPQHGAGGELQANMVEWSGGYDRRLGLPVYSLYGAVRQPTPEMLDGIDALVVDLQDVGSKVYTFTWTMLLVLEAAAARGVTVVVLDRPNPLGGIEVEGEVTRPGFRSFVGLRGIVHRHGMTLGELAMLFNAAIGARLRVVAMRGWRREMWFDETGLPWVMPSPNMPTLDTATVYPGSVLLEGTNASEGRGTTRPFELVGAPWVDGHALAAALAAEDLPGLRVRPASFIPTFDKHAGLRCEGVQLHVIDRRAFRPYRTGAALLRALWRLYPRRCGWREPPYEYEEEKLPIDILSGSDRLRRQIEAATPIADIVASWRDEEEAFRAERRPYLIYD